MLKISQVLWRHLKGNSGIQGSIRFNNYSCPAAPPTATARNVEQDSNLESNGHQLDSSSPLNTNSNGDNVTKVKPYHSIVAAAFASLKSDQTTSEILTPFTDTRITKANTIDELLSISDGSGVSRRHALKVVSVLADWSMSGKVQLSEFETDARFIKLCRVLTKNNYVGKHNKAYPVTRGEDLSVVLSVTADDEAAKLVAGISLPQMVKVMSSLAQKKRRSTPLLRSLAFNITRSLDKLDLKQAADLLYGVASLNFIDGNLLEKVSADVCLNLKGEVKKSVVIGSILTSLGLLRYKNPSLLDALSEWVTKNNNICRPQEIISLVLTLAILNHHPSNAEEVFKLVTPQLNSADAGKRTVWLDIVWSLVLLNQASNEHLMSVLSESFLKKVEEDNLLRIATKLKLLNINAASELLMTQYNGPRLKEGSNIKNVLFSRSKEKEVMVIALLDALNSLFTSEIYLKQNIDTGMGFYIDAMCALDKKCNPLPLEKASENSEAIRVAILAYDYHDMCRGRSEPTGINILSSQLLQAQGFKLLTVPYTEFNPRDKLVHRVQYIESRLKALVQS